MVLWSSQKLKTRLVARVSLPCEYNSIDQSTSKKQSLSLPNTHVCRLSLPNTHMYPTYRPRPSYWGEICLANAGVSLSKIDAPKVGKSVLYSFAVFYQNFRANHSPTVLLWMEGIFRE